LPLSEKAKITVYIPDQPEEEHLRLLTLLQVEFTNTFGGSTISRNLEGSYKAINGDDVVESINVIYTYTPFRIQLYFREVEDYVSQLRQVFLDALGEEVVLVVVETAFFAE
jgi:hypothetical protein